MKPSEIVSTMMAKDYFSQWLGVEVLEITDGGCRLRMKIRKDMLNGFGIAHGGITYSIADSALAFASNSGGRKSVSIETSINHVKSLRENDEITALAERVTETDKLGHYRVTVTDATGVIVALFKGVVYRTTKNWEV